MGLKNFFVQIPETLHKKIKRRSLDEGRPIREIIIELLEGYIKEGELKDRESRKKALQEYGAKI